MRNLFITISIIIFANYASAQNFNPKKLPKEVKNSFNQKYSDAENPVWTLKNETIYFVNFISKSKIQTASFNQLGEWLETRIRLNEADLPETILNTIKKDYSSSVIKEVNKVEKPDNNVFYQISLTEGKNSIVVFMNKNGEKIK